MANPKLTIGTITHATHDRVNALDTTVKRRRNGDIIAQMLRGISAGVAACVVATAVGCAGRRDDPAAARHAADLTTAPTTAPARVAWPTEKEFSESSDLEIGPDRPDPTAYRAVMKYWTKGPGPRLGTEADDAAIRRVVHGQFRTRIDAVILDWLSRQEATAAVSSDGGKWLLVLRRTEAGWTIFRRYLIGIAD